MEVTTPCPLTNETPPWGKLLWLQPEELVLDLALQVTDPDTPFLIPTLGIKSLTLAISLELK